MVPPDSFALVTVGYVGLMADDDEVVPDHSASMAYRVVPEHVQPCAARHSVYQRD